MSIIYEALEKRDKKNKSGGKYLKIKRKSIGILLIIIMGVIAFSFFKEKTWKDAVGKDTGIVRLEQEPAVKFKEKLISRKDRGRYNLQGIIFDEKWPIAVINGKKLNLGETIEEARLTEVSLSGVSVEVEGETLYLPLDE